VTNQSFQFFTYLTHKIEVSGQLGIKTYGDGKKKKEFEKIYDKKRKLSFLVTT
jgi:hypothetical protein